MQTIVPVNLFFLKTCDAFCASEKFAPHKHFAMCIPVTVPMDPEAFSCTDGDVGLQTFQACINRHKCVLYRFQPVDAFTILVPTQRIVRHNKQLLACACSEMLLYLLRLKTGSKLPICMHGVYPSFQTSNKERDMRLRMRNNSLFT